MQNEKKVKKRGQPSIRAKLLNMLARREYSRVEIEQKARAWLKRQNSLQADGLLDEVDMCEQIHQLSAVLDEFERRGWLSDERFVESLMNQKAHRFGARRIEQELQAKGIAEHLSQEALEKLAESEFERARDVWDRKFKQLPRDSKEYQKQMRFMVYRGFSVGIVQKILNRKNNDVD